MHKAHAGLVATIQEANIIGVTIAALDLDEPDRH